MSYYLYQSTIFGSIGQTFVLVIDYIQICSRLRSGSQ